MTAADRFHGSERAGFNQCVNHKIVDDAVLYYGRTKIHCGRVAWRTANEGIKGEVHNVPANLFRLLLLVTILISSVIDNISHCIAV